MEIFPKYISGFPERDHNLWKKKDVENTYVNCNICRNFSNILKLSHRKSKEHQKKLTEKFRTLSNQIKMLGQSTILVHDEDWQKNAVLYCYFCDKSVLKHAISDGLMIEQLGYMTHLASSEHIEAVKKYLKYHERKEKFEIFCKIDKQMTRFLGRICEARELYLKNMEVLNMKDVQSIRAVEERRKQLVKETVENAVASYDTSMIVQGQQSYSAANSSQQGYKNKALETHKVPPWQTDEVGNKPNTEPVPVIGPTMETLIKHAANKKKKGLPVRRLGANIKHSGQYSASWMPTFRGVWNKGKRKNYKSQVK